MKPFRKNVAIAIDGGGIKGVMVARALSKLEQYLKQPLHQLVGLVALRRPGEYDLSQKLADFHLPAQPLSLSEQTAVGRLGEIHGQPQDG